MARAPATIPGGLRRSDCLSVGFIARIFPRAEIRDALGLTGLAGIRSRSLPAEIKVHYVIAMALFRQTSTHEVLRCLIEGLRWLSPAERVRASGKSSISRARMRLGSETVAALRGFLRDAARRSLDIGRMVLGPPADGIRRLHAGSAR